MNQKLKDGCRIGCLMIICTSLICITGIRINIEEAFWLDHLIFCLSGIFSIILFIRAMLLKFNAIYDEGYVGEGGRCGSGGSGGDSGGCSSCGGCGGGE